MDSYAQLEEIEILPSSGQPRDEGVVELSKIEKRDDESEGIEIQDFESSSEEQNQQEIRMIGKLPTNEENQLHDFASSSEEDQDEVEVYKAEPKETIAVAMGSLEDGSGSSNGESNSMFESDEENKAEVDEILKEGKATEGPTEAVITQEFLDQSDHGFTSSHIDDDDSSEVDQF